MAENSLTGPRPVIVLGSINIDLVARVDALPRPGETVAGGDLALFLGGKGANQAVAAARAGAATRMFGALGDQSFGLDPRAMLAGYGVDVAGVAATEGPSGAALIAVDAAAENSIVVSPGANARAAEVLRAEDAALAGAVLLAQLELPPPLVRDWFAAARTAGATTILNAAPALAVPEGLFDLTDVLILNETELATYARLPVPGSEAEAEAAARALARPAGRPVVATLGAAGALALDGDRTIRQPARRTTARDTTGAGDCFCGTLAARLAEGAALDDAMAFAAAAASLSVEAEGAAPSMPERARIEAAM
ncbi:MAG: PfkB family carbohydrate kinase [Pseudomonadota bacterium]